jgi:rare lipoprotein A
LIANRPAPLGVAVVAVAFALAASPLGLGACAHATAPISPEPSPKPVPAQPLVHETPAERQDVQVGYATWYGRAFAGRKTASGERFDPRQMTAAHRSLPFGTWVEVRRVDTGGAVRVRITDRGPFGHEERIIDLSRSAAEKIGLLKAGVTKVELRIVQGP